MRVTTSGPLDLNVKCLQPVGCYNTEVNNKEIMQ